MEASGASFASSSAQATLSDTLHFDLSGYSELVPITIALRVDGSFQGNPQPRFDFIMSDGLNALATGIVGWSGLADGQQSTTATGYFNDFGHGTGYLGDWSTYGPSDFIGTFFLDPAHPDVYLGMDLTASGSNEYGDVQANFQHTAAVSFQLPSGLSFTSASGAFLTSLTSNGAVPEPGTWAMMLIGFGAIGIATRRSAGSRPFSVA